MLTSFAQDGNTALDLAASKQRSDVVELLVAHRAWIDLMQKMQRQWCRVICRSEKCLAKAKGPEKQLLNFFVERPVGAACIERTK